MHTTDDAPAPSTVEVNELPPAVQKLVDKMMKQRAKHPNVRSGNQLRPTRAPQIARSTPQRRRAVKAAKRARRAA